MSSKSGTSSSEDEQDIVQDKQKYNEEQKEENQNQTIETKEIVNQNKQQQQYNNQDLAYKKCIVCGLQNNLLRCTGCRSTYYCSIECQRSNWLEHKPKCIEIRESQKQITANQKKGKSFGDFNIIGFVGQGNFSEIYKVQDKSTKQFSALKKISKRRLSQVNKEKDVFMEKHCLSRLADVNSVINIYSTFQDEDHLYIQMELVEGGELWKEIHVFGAIGQSLIKYYFGHIIKAVKEIHQKGIIHRDIKSENILLDENHKLKFIDFGTARDFQNPQITGSGNGMRGKRNYEHFVGTPQFMAPECIRNKGSDYKSDVFSLGCLFYQLICGTTPNEAPTEYLIFTKTLETEPTFPKDWEFSEEQKDLIKNMMIKDLNQRYSIEDVMKHSYWGINWNWDQLIDFQMALELLNPQEKFLIETKNQLYELDQIQERAEQEIIREKIFMQAEKILKHENKFSEQQIIEIQQKLQYYKKQSLQLLKMENEQNQFS